MAANRRGILFIISGPSGTGKGSIIKEMLKITDPEALVLSTSMTTRKPREGEVDGVSYFFVSKEDFIKGIEAEDFLEYAEVFGNYYGTPKSKVMEKLERGIDVILEIDVQGAIAVKEKYSEAVMIFILPPSHKELRRRLNKRGTEEKDVIELRLSEAAREISCLYNYDYRVINGHLEEAVNDVMSIMRTEHLKVNEEIYDIINEYKEEI